MAGTVPGADTLLKDTDSADYVIAWKKKYDFETGRLDETMTYGEALAEAMALSEQDRDKVYWPESVSGNPYLR